MSNFDELLTELESLNKAFSDDAAGTGADMDDPEDDRRIEEAATDGSEEEESEEERERREAEEAEAAEAAEVGNGEGSMSKAFRVKLANGEEVEAVDGTEMVKALTAKVEGFDAKLAKAIETTIGSLKGANAQMTQANGTIAKQDKLIKSLQASIDKIGGEGRGRRTTLNVHEKGNESVGLEKSAGLNPDEFMGKAMNALNEGRLSGSDISVSESYINRGMAPPERIVKKVLG